MQKYNKYEYYKDILVCEYNNFNIDITKTENIDNLLKQFKTKYCLKNYSCLCQTNRNCTVYISPIDIKRIDTKDLLWASQRLQSNNLIEKIVANYIINNK